MIKEKILYIEYKVFSKDKIILLSNNIFQIYQQNNSTHKSFNIKFSLKNNTSYEYENENVESSSDALLNLDLLSKIVIDFIDYQNNNKISLDLDTNSRYKGYIQVKGTDSRFVDSSFDIFEKIINEVKNQDCILIKHQTLSFAIINLIYGIFILILLFNIMIIFNVPAADNSSNINLLILEKIIDFFINRFPYLIHLVLLCSSWFLGYFMISLFKSELLSLWPSIEFYEYNSKRQNTKKIVPYVVIFTPLVLEVLLILMG